jgi:hypothetical protein
MDDEVIDVIASGAVLPVTCTMRGEALGLSTVSPFSTVHATTSST